MIAKLLIANGYQSILSFKGHFHRGTTDEAFITSLEKFVHDLNDDSPFLAELKLNAETKNTFKLADGEISTVLGLMQEMKKICAREIPFQHSTPAPPSRSRPSQPRSQQGEEITAANAESAVQKVIRKRLGTLLAYDDDEVLVVSSKTSNFPYCLKVKCIKCDKTFSVSISLDKRAGRSYNIQSIKYTKHVESCNNI